MSPSFKIPFVDRISMFVKQHERLIIVALAAVLLWFLSGKVQDIVAAHDNKVYAAAVAERQAQAEANARQAEQNAKTAEEFRQLALQVTETNRRLEQANAALATALRQQQKTDETLPPQQLAERAEALSELPPGSIMPVPDDKFLLSHPALVSITQHLEVAPVLQQQLTNVQAERDGLSALLQKEGVLVSGQNQLIAGLQAELKKADTACDARVKVEKDKASKGKRKAFVIGYIAGIGTSIAVKLFGL